MWASFASAASAKAPAAAAAAAVRGSNSIARVPSIPRASSLASEEASASAS